MKSKEEIIKILLNQLPNNTTKINSTFIKPNNPIRNAPTNYENNFKVPLSNRFAGLKDDAIDIEIINNTIKSHETNRNTVASTTKLVTENRLNPSSTTTIPPKPPKKSVVFFSDSVAQRIIYREFNRWTDNHQTHFYSFRGATSKSLTHYIEPTILNEKHDTAIIHTAGQMILPQDKIHQF